MPKIRLHKPNTKCILVKLDLRDEPNTIQILAEKKSAPITYERELAIQKDWSNQQHQTLIIDPREFETSF